MPQLPALLAILACLMGAAGVASAAAGGHGGSDTRLASAALLLLVHAAGGLAILALVRIQTIGLIAVGLLEFGAILFAADMASRTWRGPALFPMAAPAGGTILIVGWIVAAVAFLLALR